MQRDNRSRKVKINALLGQRSRQPDAAIEHQTRLQESILREMQRPINIICSMRERGNEIASLGSIQELHGVSQAWPSRSKRLEQSPLQWRLSQLQGTWLTDRTSLVKVPFLINLSTAEAAVAPRAAAIVERGQEAETKSQKGYYSY